MMHLSVDANTHTHTFLATSVLYCSLTLGEFECTGEHIDRSILDMYKYVKCVNMFEIVLQGNKIIPQFKNHI